MSPLARLALSFSVALLALPGARPAAATGDEECSDPAVRDSYACREIVLAYDPARFDWERMERPRPDGYGLRLVGLLPPIGQAWYLAPPGTSVPGLLLELEALVADPAAGVLDVERNGLAENPECRQLNEAVLELGRDAELLYRAQEARAVLGALPGSAPGSGVTVAVLDTGVARDHPALAGSLVTPGIDALQRGHGPADDRGDGRDGDGDGAVDEGWGHGTAVAGLVRLVAPGARILPVRVLDDECRGRAFHFAEAIVRAADAGARVLNLSFGALDKSSAVADAIAYAVARGAVVVAPSGNSGDDEVLYPADDSEAVAVAAVDADLLAPTWATWGSDVDLVAPGVAVVAPLRGGYARLSGSSFATALVSGVAAAALWADPALTPAALAELLEATATPVDGFNPEWLDGKLGEGVPDLGRLVLHVRRAQLGRRTQGPVAAPAPAPVPTTQPPTTPLPTAPLPME